VNIGHKRHGRFFGKGAQHIGGGKIGHGKAEKPAAHGGKLFDTIKRLPSGFAFKTGKRKAVFPHGLNDYGITASD
jgi:hypothetical protein